MMVVLVIVLLKQTGVVASVARGLRHASANEVFNVMMIFGEAVVDIETGVSSGPNN